MSVLQLVLHYPSPLHLALHFNRRVRVHLPTLPRSRRALQALIRPLAVLFAPLLPLVHTLTHKTLKFIFLAPPERTHRLQVVAFAFLFQQALIQEQAPCLVQRALSRVPWARTHLGRRRLAFQFPRATIHPLAVVRVQLVISPVLQELMLPRLG